MKFKINPTNLFQKKGHDITLKGNYLLDKYQSLYIHLNITSKNFQIWNVDSPCAKQGVL